MLILLVAVFVLAYAAIALEHPIKINKAASAPSRRGTPMDDLRPVFR